MDDSQTKWVRAHEAVRGAIGVLEEVAAALEQRRRTPLSEATVTAMVQLREHVQDQAQALELWAPPRAPTCLDRSGSGSGSLSALGAHAHAHAPCRRLSPAAPDPGGDEPKARSARDDGLRESLPALSPRAGEFPVGGAPSRPTVPEAAAAGKAQHWPLAAISAYIIDLDGTMYTPTGRIEGADTFYSYLAHQRIPHVFCSNTGAKGAPGVQAKLAKNGFMLQAAPVPAAHIYTAAQAQCDYMVERLPPQARVFVFAGGAEEVLSDSFWLKELRERDAPLVDSWNIRTRLSELEAKEWAAVASAHPHMQQVFVVLFSDGSIKGNVDPTTGEEGFADWSFDVIKKAAYLLSHGAEFICSAEDAFNPQPDAFPLPGPGMIAAMFRKLVYPLGKERFRVCGKGGREGATYLLERAIAMLRAQGHSGRREEILIVGDRFDTDIRAGVQAAIRTCLVESGCHCAALQKHYPADRAEFVASSVAELLPPSWYAHFRAVADLNRRTKSFAGAPGLQTWMLGQGNLVYQACHPSDSLVLQLRSYFYAKDVRKRGLISTEDAALGLAQLGLAPTTPRGGSATPRGGGGSRGVGGSVCSPRAADSHAVEDAAQRAASPTREAPAPPKPEVSFGDFFRSVQHALDEAGLKFAMFGKPMQESCASVESSPSFLRLQSNMISSRNSQSSPDLPELEKELGLLLNAVPKMAASSSAHSSFPATQAMLRRQMSFSPEPAHEDLAMRRQQLMSLSDHELPWQGEAELLAELAELQERQSSASGTTSSVAAVIKRWYANSRLQAQRPPSAAAANARASKASAFQRLSGTDGIKEGRSPLAQHEWSARRRSEAQ